MITDNTNGSTQVPGTNPAPDQLAGLESAIDAAREALSQPPVSPAQPVVEPTPQSPTEEFQSVFGSGEPTEAVASDPSGLTDVGNLQQPEASQPDPLATFAQEIKAAVKKLEESQGK